MKQNKYMRTDRQAGKQKHNNNNEHKKKTDMSLFLCVFYKYILLTRLSNICYTTNPGFQLELSLTIFL